MSRTVRSRKQQGAQFTRKCVLVAGMHRSGTSALTRVLNLLGAELPGSLMPPMAGNNERGFWESTKIADLNDRVLAAAGLNWHSACRFPRSWLDSDSSQPYKKAALAILQEDFANSQLFVLKDPRICRILPFWTDVLTTFEAWPHFAIPVRHPLEVAASLNRRDQFALPHGLLLWLRHSLDAEHDSRNFPRAFLTYESLLQDWRAAVKRLEAELHLALHADAFPLASQVDAFLTADLRHNEAAPDALAGREDIVEWVEESYDALLALCTANGNSNSALDRLDRVRDSLDTAELAFAPLLTAQESRIAELTGRGDQLAQEIRRYQESLPALGAEHQAQVAVLQGELGAIRGQLAELAAQRDDAVAALAEREQAIVRLRSDHDEMAKTLASESDALASAETALTETMQTVAELEARIDALAGERDLGDQRIADLEATLDERDGRIGELEVELGTVYGSRSWRMTRPVRLVMGRLRSRAYSLRRPWRWPLLALALLFPRPLRRRLLERRRVRVLRRSGLFDERFYLEQNPDVAASGMNPIVHYLRHGASEGRNPAPSFDTRSYLEANPDVARAGMNPLLHYVRHGLREGRMPTEAHTTTPSNLDDSPMQSIARSPVQSQPAFGRASLSSYARIFLMVVRTEGFSSAVRKAHRKLSQIRAARRDRLPPPSPPPAIESTNRLSSSTAGARMFLGNELVPMSVVIPTYNRGELLSRTLELCRSNAGGVDLEFVVIDDGSTDDTADRLKALASKIPNLVWRSIPNGGPGQARNLGAHLARHPVVHFLGDDIHPTDGDFFRVHSQIHASNPEINLAVLGKIVWPSGRDSRTNFVMQHIQGHGGEQFGYADFVPYSFLDYRFFYTANISVKKEIASDWIDDGFSGDFKAAAFEDIEFGYRMTKSAGLRIFYTPASTGTHHHQYSVNSFINRQISAGMMAYVFCQKHAEMLDVLGLRPVVNSLEKPPDRGDDAALAEVLSIIEGLKSWARLIEIQANLGSQPWHDDMLRAVFHLCFLQGFVSSWQHSHGNLFLAYRMALDEFFNNMRRSLHHEVTGNALSAMKLRPWGV